jgi:hypothetical protein
MRGIVYFKLESGNRELVLEVQQLKHPGDDGICMLVQVLQDVTDVLFKLPLSFVDELLLLLLRERKVNLMRGALDVPKLLQSQYRHSLAS